MYAWLRKNNSYYRNSTNARTHTIMSGGVLHVGEDDYDEFLCVYAKEIESGNKTITFSELRSDPNFKMYFDVDMVEKEVLPYSFVKDMVSVMQKVMRNFFPDVDEDELKCVVCTTPVKNLKVKKPTEEDPEACEEFVKNGYHIIYPSIIVDFVSALQIRYSIVSELIKKFGERPVPNIWSDVIDKAPYYNGLKMCGSVKTVKCSECKGATKNIMKKSEVTQTVRAIRDLRRRLYPRKDDPSFNYSDMSTIDKVEFKNNDLAVLYSKYSEAVGDVMCYTCHNRGWCYEDRAYMPKYVFDIHSNDYAEIIDLLTKDLCETMRWTSIRCPPSTELSPYFVPEGTPTAPMESTASTLVDFGKNLQKVSPGVYRELLNSDMFADDSDGIKKWRGVEITDDIVREDIQTVIRKIHVKYAEVEVKSMFELHVAKRVEEDGLDSCVFKGKSSQGKKTKKIFSDLASSNNASVSSNTPSRTKVSVVKRIAVRVHGTGSTFCLNKDGEHTTNHIYFMVSPVGIYQKCFSRKDPIGCSGYKCIEYKGTVYNVPVATRRILFEEEMDALDKSSQSSILRGQTPDIKNTSSKTLIDTKKRMWECMF